MDRFGFLKVAAAVPHVQVADCDFNIERIVALAEEAARRGVEIVAFPELAVTAYTCGDLLLQPTLLDAAEEALGELVRRTRRLPLVLKDQYFNMRKMVEPHPQVIDKALQAMEMAGVKPLVRPIRGGTDGARLSFMGLPCPNLFTGGMNFHGKFEYCSLTTMHKAMQVILNLAQLWAK